jgi:hypothetical protein
VAQAERDDTVDVLWCDLQAGKCDAHAVFGE